MGWIVSLVVVLVGTCVFLGFGRLGQVFVTRLKLQFRSGATEVVARSEAGDQLPVLDAAAPVLEREGFIYVRTLRVLPVLASPCLAPYYRDDYYNPALDVHATVVVSDGPGAHRPFDIYLWNSSTDGRTLHTGTGPHDEHIPSACNRLVVVAGARIDALLEAHLAARAEMGETLAGSADALAFANASAQQVLPRLVADGKAYLRGEADGHVIYGLRPLHALAMARQRMVDEFKRDYADEFRLSAEAEAQPLQDKAADDAIAGATSAGPARPASAPFTAAAPEVLAAAQRIAFVRALCGTHALLAPRWFRWALFTLSAAAFVAVGTWWWGILFALVTVAVVALHEAGHWLVMRLARFRKVHVFFVPGFGGATTGEKHDATPLTHLAVYLAGPVPGLILAVAAMAWMVLGGQGNEQSWWYALLAMTAALTFVINLFNLLPLMPFDGGRVVDLFVIARLPWLRFALVAGSAVLLGWSAIVTDSRIMQGFALILLITVPHHYRVAKVASGLLRARQAAPPAGLPFAQAAAQLHDVLSAPAYADWDFDKRIAVSHLILPRFLGRFPTPAQAAAGLALYLACLVLPVAAVWMLAVKEPDRMSYVALGGWYKTLSGGQDKGKAAQAEARAAVPVALTNDRILAQATTPARRRAELANLADVASDSEDFEEALRLARLLYAETAEHPQLAGEHANAALLLASSLIDCACGGMEQAGSLLKQEEARVRRRLQRLDNKDDALRLVWILETRLRGGDDGLALTGRHAIVELLAHYRDAVGVRLPLARVELARELDQRGQAAAAEKQLRTAAGEYAAIGADASYRSKALVMDTAWFLMGHGRTGEALALVQPFLVKPAPLAAGGDGFYREALGLAAFQARSAGRWQQVRAYTLPIHDRPARSSGKWLTDLYRKSPLAMPRHDLAAALMLLEAQRALGQAEAADTLAARLRRQYRQGRGGAVGCRFDRHPAGWRQPYHATLAAIEARELKCVAG